jgi:hypothetical protein
MEKKQMVRGKENDCRHTFSLRLPTELVKRIEDIARQENRSRNNTIEWLLTKAVRDKK